MSNPDPPDTVSVSSSDGDRFEAISRRHRLIRIVGGASTGAGLLLALFIGYEWYIRQPRVSHEVLAVVAGFALMLGIQLLVFSTLTGMLIALHHEQLRRFGDD